MKAKTCVKKPKPNKNLKPNQKRNPRITTKIKNNFENNFQLNLDMKMKASRSSYNMLVKFQPNPKNNEIKNQVLFIRKVV